LGGQFSQGGLDVAQGESDSSQAGFQSGQIKIFRARAFRGSKRKVRIRKESTHQVRDDLPPGGPTSIRICKRLPYFNVGFTEIVDFMLAGLIQDDQLLT
jgi:hypothetical protein